METEIIERSDSQTQEDLNSAMNVKDGLRENGLSEIINLLHTVIANHTVFDDAVIDKCLKCLSYLIDWAPIELFEPFI